MIDQKTEKMKVRGVKLVPPPSNGTIYKEAMTEHEGAGSAGTGAASDAFWVRRATIVQATGLSGGVCV